MSHRASYITEEEMAYLRQLFAEPAGEEAPAGAGLRGALADPAQGLDLLQGMSAELVATDGAYRLVFEVKVERTADGEACALRLSYPNIVDRQGMERLARVQPQGEVDLQDPSGWLRRARIDDLSGSGLALSGEVSRLIRPGAVFEGLRLQLPRAEVVLRGRVVRTASGRRPLRQRLALQFEGLSPQAREALRGYVFSRHRAIRRGPVALN